MRASRKLRLRNGLTAKENAFKNKIVEQLANTGQMNVTQAALETYDTTDPKTASVIGSKNLDKDRVQNEIEKALRKQGITLDVISGNLRELANSEVRYVTSAVKLNTNLALFKILGGNSNGKNTNNITINQQINNISYSEAKKRIESMNGESTDLMQDAEI